MRMGPAAADVGSARSGWHRGRCRWRLAVADSSRRPFLRTSRCARCPSLRGDPVTAAFRSCGTLGVASDPAEGSRRFGAKALRLDTSSPGGRPALRAPPARADVGRRPTACTSARADDDDRAVLGSFWSRRIAVTPGAGRLDALARSMSAPALRFSAVGDLLDYDAAVQRTFSVSGTG